MGFFDKIRSGRLFFGKQEIPTMIVHFLFKGQTYIVEEFDLNFKQDVDSKGRPDSSVYGGQMTITMSDLPDENINQWMMDSYKKEEGEFRFFANEGKIQEGALLQIRFKDAYCIDYQKTINPRGNGVLTTLIISPRYLNIGAEEFENSWK